MDLVILSAYNTTSEFGFLAALHIICIKAVVDLKNHSLSASNIAINVTSGISIHSLNKFTQTIISIIQSLSFLIISYLSSVSISECKKYALYHFSKSKFDISSADLFVVVIIKHFHHFFICHCNFINM